MKDEPLKVGDIVSHKSERLMMKIEELEGDEALCSTLAKKKTPLKRFKINELTKVRRSAMRAG